MKPQVPEGLRVEYEYHEATHTHTGRKLARPHRAITAWLLGEPHDGISCVMGLGTAIAKEGPLADGSDLKCNGQCKLDQFSRQIGRDIALGRALKDYERLAQTAEAALSA